MLPWLPLPNTAHSGEFGTEATRRAHSGQSKAGHTSQAPSSACIANSWVSAGARAAADLRHPRLGHSAKWDAGLVLGSGMVVVCLTATTVLPEAWPLSLGRHMRGAHPLSGLAALSCGPLLENGAHWVAGHTCFRSSCLHLSREDDGLFCFVFSFAVGKAWKENTTDKWSVSPPESRRARRQRDGGGRKIYPTVCWLLTQTHTCKTKKKYQLHRNTKLESLAGEEARE